MTLNDKYIIMRTLINCENDFEARLIVGRLENEGIKAVVLNGHIHDVWPMSSSSDFAIRVAVNEEDYNQAIKIISVDTEPTDDAVID